MDRIARTMRPTIGVTGPEIGGGAAWWFTRLAVFRAGGKPVRLTSSEHIDARALDGLILGGGADINPKLYGQEKIEWAKEVVRKKHTFTHSIIRIIFFPIIFYLRRILSSKLFIEKDEKRDAFEHAFLEKALYKNIPILGICRGCQLINVFMGGTLFQELSQFYTETPQFHSVFPKKEVHISPETRIEKVFKARSLKVNALHRQAIDKPGNNILVSAKDGSEVIQAVEFSENRFVIGVQWHPEYLPQKKIQQEIFNALVFTSRFS